MIDWILSKVWIAIVVVILILSVMGFYVFVYNSLSTNSFVQITTEIGVTISKISTMSSNYTENIVYSSSQPGLVLPLTIVKYSLPFNAQKYPYTINITNESVILEWDNNYALYYFVLHIHPWNLTKYLSNTFYVSNYTLYKLDMEHPYFKVPSGTVIVIKQVELSVSGNLEYETFVYPANNSAS
ncbi:MAG: hypothetical protein ACP5RS_04565 [Thermoplasmata archaeon]